MKKFTRRLLNEMSQFKVEESNSAIKNASVEDMCKCIIKELGDNYLYDILEDKVVISKGVPSCEKVVYIMKDNFNRIKIGVSQNSIGRNKEISDISGLNIINIYESRYCSNWSEIENNMHKIFRKCKIKGEWFNIDEKDAIAELNNQNFKNEKYKSKDKKYEYTLEQLCRIYKIVNSGSYNGCNYDDEFELNCTKEELKKEISNLIIMEDDERYEYLIGFYFDIFEEEKIQYENFYIEPFLCYESFATLNDGSYGDKLWKFKINMEGDLKY